MVFWMTTAGGGAGGGKCYHVTVDLQTPCMVFRVRDVQRRFAMACLSVMTLVILGSLLS